MDQLSVLVYEGREAARLHIGLFLELLKETVVLDPEHVSVN